MNRRNFIKYLGILSPDFDPNGFLFAETTIDMDHVIKIDLGRCGAFQWGKMNKN